MLVLVLRIRSLVLVLHMELVLHMVLVLHMELVRRSMLELGCRSMLVLVRSSSSWHKACSSCL